MHPMYENSARLIGSGFRKLSIGIAGCLLWFSASSATAEVAAWATYYEASAAERATSLEIADDYAMGVDRFDLDEHTEILGWQLSQRWYFGRQDGKDSGLTFVWQQNAKQQVSVSKEGLRLTRRF